MKNDPIFRVEGISINFGGLQALENINFDVSRNEVLSIIGPNGAGKTTLFNIITGFLQPSGGEIYYMGDKITKLQPYEIVKKRITRTFQSTNVFPEMGLVDSISVAYDYLTNHSPLDILFNRRKFREDEETNRKKSLEILKLLNLPTENIHASKLPYGELRILEIAIALGTEPKILLLDEPTAGLPPNDSKRILNVIDILQKQGITIIIIEHNMNVVMNISDRVIVLNAGKKLIEGPPAEVKKDERVIAAYLGRRWQDAVN